MQLLVERSIPSIYSTLLMPMSLQMQINKSIAEISAIFYLSHSRNLEILILVIGQE